MEMEQKDCSLKVEKLIEKHAWIASEKQLFGRSGTDYDFGSRDPRDARETFEKLQADQAGSEPSNLFQKCLCNVAEPSVSSQIITVSVCTLSNHTATFIWPYTFPFYVEGLRKG